MIQHAIFKKIPFNSATFNYYATKKRRRGQGQIITSGSSTTVITSGAVQAFSEAAINDELTVRLPTVTPSASLAASVRYITAKASNDSVTVDSAVNITTASAWSHQPQRGGTTDADGWVDISDMELKELYIVLITKGSTGATPVTYTVEIRGAGQNQTPMQITTGTLTAAAVAGTISVASQVTFPIPEFADDIRVGIKNDASGTDVLSAWVTGNDDFLRG